MLTVRNTRTATVAARCRAQRCGWKWLAYCGALVAACWGATLTDALAGSALPTDPYLHEQRAGRRLAMRRAVAAKSANDDPALFGLLVIPVDFADARRPDGWDAAAALGPRLLPADGETLTGYYRIASSGRADLRITLVPLIHLAGERSDYSDVGLGGSGVPRSQAMATEAITAVRDLGVAFRQLDMEGPDRRAGTADDDGEVDGVLILHAGPGIENDPGAGLIQPLQYYLDVPVVDRGVQASSYAVASMTSGLGVWAHETGHLFGLEDRYDPAGTPDAGDVTARGGLGIFSLMAAGAWGTGAGAGPALLDAYSCLQLAWCDLRELPTTIGLADTLRPAVAGGYVGRLWTAGVDGPEYFLVENRGGAAVAPFDAALPGGQLLIYHIDETLAESEASAGNYPDRHLRVAVVEADGDGALAQPPEFDLGGPGDLFPGTVGATEFGSHTVPASLGYDGTPTEVHLTGITSLGDAVAFTASCATAPRLALSFAFSADAPAVLQLQARELGPPLSQLQVTISALPPAGGQFVGGGTEVLRALAPGVVAGTWELAGEPTLWLADAALPPGFTTRFALSFSGTTTDQADFAWSLAREWIWLDDPGALDFAGSWPGAWQISHPAENTATTWHRWPSSAGAAPDGSPLLVCSGQLYGDGASWPDIHYENDADAVLTSPALGPGLVAVRLVHFVETETLGNGSGLDGCVVEWLGPDAQVTPAVPTDGYPTVIDPQSLSALHGRPAFAGSDPLGPNALPTWRVDTFVLPAGPGPYRLRLRLASNGLWRYRGWLIARCDPLATLTDGSAFPVAWLPPAGGDGPRLAWNWRWEEPVSFRVEARVGQHAPWQEVFVGAPPGSAAGDYQYSLPADTGLLGALLADPAARVEARVTAEIGLGAVLSRTVVYYDDGGAPIPGQLGLPFPNPAHSDVRLAVTTAAQQPVELALFDLRGRLIRQWQLAGGSQILLWDGCDAAGRKQAAGVYLFRLQDGSGSYVRKVTWLP